MLEYVKSEMLKHTLDSKDGKVTPQLKEFFDCFNNRRGFYFSLPKFMGEK
jgi:hypothetical protein